MSLSRRKKLSKMDEQFQSLIGFNQQSPSVSDSLTHEVYLRLHR